MQLGLVSLAIVFLGSMGHSDSGLKLSKARRQRRISTEGPLSCSNGCERCSDDNGCLKCKPKLFILLERNDIRQIGVCFASCPQGYFGMRNPDTNRCIQCKIENCEACFNRNFCTKCKEGFYSHRGRCYISCPEGLSTTNGTMECVDRKNKGERRDQQRRRDRENGHGHSHEGKEAGREGSREVGREGGKGRRKKGQSQATTTPNLTPTTVT
ncbi:R-spondin-1 isoform X2 [Esox lucius]|uniref:R-spondin-1 isoform X2 n=1 Tax=Esox lucius TaxID=8010 RepID=UPI001476DC4A|nr:R-spondin-1 isoform X2 [Esox lucius]